MSYTDRTTRPLQSAPAAAAPPLFFLALGPQHQLLADVAARPAGGMRKLRLATFGAGYQRDWLQSMMRPPGSNSCLGDLFYRKHFVLKLISGNRLHAPGRGGRSVFTHFAETGRLEMKSFAFIFVPTDPAPAAQVRAGAIFCQRSPSTHRSGATYSPLVEADLPPSQNRVTFRPPLRV